MTNNGEIIEPTMPEKLVGHKWNSTVYGKSGSHSIYLDGEKVLITDTEADELRQYVADNERYKKLCRAQELGILEEYIEACEEKQREIDSLVKPVPPEKIRDVKWNGTIYGKNGAHSIYVSGNRIMLSDSEAEEIRKYLIDLKTYEDKLETIEEWYWQFYRLTW